MDKAARERIAAANASVMKKEAEAQVQCVYVVHVLYIICQSHMHTL
jgi:hypothetical protein